MTRVHICKKADRIFYFNKEVLKQLHLSTEYGFGPCGLGTYIYKNTHKGPVVVFFVEYFR